MNVCKSNTFVREDDPMLLIGTYYLLYGHTPNKKVVQNMAHNVTWIYCFTKVGISLHKQ